MRALDWPPTRRRFDGVLTWLREADAARRVALYLTLAAITLVAVGLFIAAQPSVGDPGAVSTVLNIALLPLILLAGLVIHRVVVFIRPWRKGAAGSQLQMQFVALFSVAAVVPALLMAIFTGVFLHRGMEVWFGERIDNALRTSLNVAEAYLEEHKENIRADALAMASDLNREGPAMANNPRLFQRLVETQAVLRSLTEAVVFQSDGSVVARTGLSFFIELERLPPEALARAAEGGITVLTSDDDDRVRALVRLDSFVDAYLFVGRFVDPLVISYMDRTQQAVDSYERMQAERRTIQRSFSIIFALVSLLLLLAAIWFGLSIGERFAVPISKLIQAAGLVTAGDLRARVPETVPNSEIASLSRAFNRMTTELDAQRQALMQANGALDTRRRFTETIVANVSGGIIALDGRGVVTLINPSAAAFLAIEPDAAVGRPIIALLPEVAGLLAKAATAPERSLEQQVELIREGEGRSLLVRIQVQGQEDGERSIVLTFDDLSDLLQAQRKAAWAEIARRIAHEIKNPLTPIQLSAERLKRKYLKQIETDPETFVGCTDTIIRQVDSIGRLIDEFSSFARMPAPVFRFESAPELIRQAILMHQTAQPHIRFRAELPARDVALYCDAHQVAQALINLLQNSSDAISESPEQAQPGEVAVELQETAEHCRIVITDNGPGYPAQLLDKLTRPYVTTREKGTGLGLAIVAKIMEEHNGRLILTNQTKGGARVVLQFPRASSDRLAIRDASD